MSMVFENKVESVIVNDEKEAKTKNLVVDENAFEKPLVVEKVA